MAASAVQFLPLLVSWWGCGTLSSTVNHTLGFFGRFLSLYLINPRTWMTTQCTHVYNRETRRHLALFAPRLIDPAGDFLCHRHPPEPRRGQRRGRPSTCSHVTPHIREPHERSGTCVGISSITRRKFCLDPDVFCSKWSEWIPDCCCANSFVRAVGI